MSCFQFLPNSFSRDMSKTVEKYPIGLPRSVQQSYMFNNIQSLYIVEHVRRTLSSLFHSYLSQVLLCSLPVAKVCLPV